MSVERKSDYRCVMVVNVPDWHSPRSFQCWMVPSKLPSGEGNVYSGGCGESLIADLSSKESVFHYSFANIDNLPSEIEDWNGFKVVKFTDAMFESKSEFTNKKESLEFCLWHFCKGKLLVNPPHSSDANFDMVTIYNQSLGCF